MIYKRPVDLLISPCATNKQMLISKIWKCNNNQSNYGPTLPRSTYMPIKDNKNQMMQFMEDVTVKPVLKVVIIFANSSKKFSLELKSTFLHV